MDARAPSDQPADSLDSGLVALVGLAGFYRVAADPVGLARELAMRERKADAPDLVRAAKLIGLKARIYRGLSAQSLKEFSVPVLAQRLTGGWVIIEGGLSSGKVRIVDPITRADVAEDADEVVAGLAPDIVLVKRRFSAVMEQVDRLNLRWFAATLWRYRAPLRNVIIASFFVQIFALVSPLFFQVVVDKVLVHNTVSTLNVLITGLVAVILFDTLLQFLRTFVLTHTASRIDVELGHRLFSHLARLPIAYFESRPAGQTVARMRELEKIRTFLTGQALTSLLDLFFALVFVAVLFFYSTQMALLVVASFPLYVLTVVILRPLIEARVEDMFRTGAASQQFLVESIVGMPTLKAAAIEPQMRAEWDERLAAYVRDSFETSRLGAIGQNIIQLINRLVTAGILFFGAHLVMNGDMSVGALVAFNMIAGQVSQPVLRLSQLWQDFQQVKVSMARIGDILESRPEQSPGSLSALPPPRGDILFKDVTFRYTPNGTDVIQDLSLAIRAGMRVGIVGPSGSGKSSLAKLLQRFYVPQQGRVLLDGIDLSSVDPSWLRRQTGVVLQENVLFNRSVHENIALANPALPRQQVIRAAQMAGAHEFIAKLPEGYDSMIEERGANLSGGQRQRIAIARALVMDPRILIFDEATSALDYESEAAIQKNMDAIAKGRTVIIIAHRLSTVRECDLIICMYEGRIVDGGTHSELMANPKSLYARLWALQVGAAA